ncbi:MAG: flagellar hook-associated protein FlgL [Nitrospiria bacterium]
MRVSDKMIFSAITDRMRRQQESIFRIQEQISTGKKVNRPSDDPVNQAGIIGSEKTLSEIDQFIRNNDQADASLSLSETVLQTMEDQLIRTRELALLAANDTNSAVDRANIAKEVRQIYDHIVSLANTSQGGRYIFAGNETGTVPFLQKGDYIAGPLPALPITITAAVNDQLSLSLDGITSTVTLTPGTYNTGAALAGMIQTVINADTTFQTASVSATVTFDTTAPAHLVVQSNAVGGGSSANITGGTARAAIETLAGTSRAVGSYLGDSGEARIAIDQNHTIIKNLPGDRLIKGAFGGTDVLAAVAGLQLALESNAPAGIQTALSSLNGASDQVSNERVLLGARLNRVTTTTAALEDFKSVTIRLKSEQEDVDIATAVSELVFEENALEISRSLASRIFNMSLMDFLR